jgi:hypothetical protein
MIGYDQQPAFDVRAPGQKTMQTRIDEEVKWGRRGGALRRAIEAEGLLESWIEQGVIAREGGADGNDKRQGKIRDDEDKAKL